VKWLEKKFSITLKNSNIRLEGKLDRVDEGPDGLSLIDYKTGSGNRLANIESGEDVQLTSYALMVNNPQEMLYLSLDPKSGESLQASASVDHEGFEKIAPALYQRLDDLLLAIKNGASMPAWGDNDSCRYCSFSGLCRRDSWEIPDTLSA
jgi:ATP-dependent helicase/nuclease subunit B